MASPGRCITGLSEITHGYKPHVCSCQGERHARTSERQPPGAFRRWTRMCRHGAMATARRCVLAGTMRAITTMRDNASMRLAAAVRDCQPIASRRKPCVWERPRHLAVTSRFMPPLPAASKPPLCLRYRLIGERYLAFVAYRVAECRLIKSGMAGR